MSKQANKAMIGAFVVGAAALVIFGVLLFGTGKFFKETREYVLFFDGSLKGLDVGAPVMFRGVKVGSVTDIKVMIDREDLDIWIPVFIELEADRFTEVSDLDLFAKQSTADQDKSRQILLVERGLRAQLQVQSVVTGKLLVALDFHPDAPLNFRSHLETPEEMPTIPSALEVIAETFGKLVNKLQELPLDEIIEKGVSTLDGIDQLVNAPDTMESIENLNQSLKDIQKLVKDVNKHVDPLATSIEGTFQDAGKLVRNIDEQIDPIALDIDAALDSAHAAFAQAEQTLATVEKNLTEKSPLRREIITTLESLSAAARSLQVLADFLQRHPEALIKGKGGPGGK